ISDFVLRIFPSSRLIHQFDQNPLPTTNVEEPFFLFGFGGVWGFISVESMTDSQKLIEAYARDGSEAAFRELVARYINLVYSTALRLVDRNVQSAEDVTQMVFVHLSHQARKLCREPFLGGWLHRDTCYQASKTLRGERRRLAREQ